MHISQREIGDRPLATLPKCFSSIAREYGDAATAAVIVVATPFVALYDGFSVYMAAATFSYSCLLAGAFLRKRRATHVPFMAVGILVDLGIVLTLEVKRHAVKTALAFTLAPLQQLHIGTSTIATILYLPIIYFGLRSAIGRGTNLSRIAHKRIGICAFVFRTLGFFLMFSLLWKNP